MSLVDTPDSNDEWDLVSKDPTLETKTPQDVSAAPAAALHDKHVDVYCREDVERELRNALDAQSGGNPNIPINLVAAKSYVDAARNMLKCVEAAALAPLSEKDLFLETSINACEAMIMLERGEWAGWHVEHISSDLFELLPDWPGDLKQRTPIPSSTKQDNLHWLPLFLSAYCHRCLNDDTWKRIQGEGGVVLHRVLDDMMFAADVQDSSLAQVLLGWCYLFEFGLSKNEERALKLYLRSGRGGCALGEYLGLCTSKLTANETKAPMLVLAKKGYGRAQREVYQTNPLDGNFMPLLHQARDQGNVLSHHLVAAAGAEDVNLVIKSTKFPASQGCPEAREFLATYYEGLAAKLRQEDDEDESASRPPEASKVIGPALPTIVVLPRS